MPVVINEPKLDFRDVFLTPKRSTLQSRNDVDLEQEYMFKHSKKIYKGIPIIASNMDTVGTFEMAKALDSHGMFTTIHKHYTVDEWTSFVAEVGNDSKILKNVAVSVGLASGDLSKARKIYEEIPEVEYICLDVANGYSEHFVDLIRKVREEFEKLTIFAGNVVTEEMTEELILAGADVVKIGIGPGSVCTTRKKSGIGYPQFSAVLECAYAAHGLGGFVISDGGCTNPGDVAKAFGGGADFVMLGGMFAGHDQSGGEIITKHGKKYKLFYGMASDTAMKKHGQVAEYRASEGKTIQIPYRGDVNATVNELLGGLRSACAYTGARFLKELPKRAKFIRVNQQTNEIFSPFEAPASDH